VIAIFTTDGAQGTSRRPNRPALEEQGPGKVVAGDARVRAVTPAGAVREVQRLPEVDCRREASGPTHDRP
jgi:hypothetical protein